MKLGIVEIGQLQLYNQDLDDQPSAEWTAFRKRTAGCNAVLFVTPEYNRSIPAALKNALDVGSRPYGKSVWNGKPGAIVSASPSAIGGFGANHHLRQTFVFLNLPAMQQPEAYLGLADKLFDQQGKLSNPDTGKSCRISWTPTRHGSPPTQNRRSCLRAAPCDAGPLQHLISRSWAEICPRMRASRSRPSGVSKGAEIVRYVAGLPDRLGVAEVAAEGSPVRENAMAPAWPGMRESASARMTAAFALRHSAGSPAATPSSEKTNGRAT